MSPPAPNAPVPAPPKANSPWFSRKNSRFSGKNRLNRVRLTCCSSASTCAKSVFTVRSAVRFWVTPYFTSMPPSPPILFEIAGVEDRSLVRSAMAYGLISMLRDPGGASSPVSAAPSETWKWPRPLSAAGIGVRYEISFRHRLRRRTCRPHVWSRPGLYRSDLNGIAASITHPPSNIPVRTSQIGFQSELTCVSLVIWPSSRPPSGLTSNRKPLRRSKNVSMLHAKLSFRTMPKLSRRISLATRRSGSVSQQRPTM